MQRIPRRKPQSRQYWEKHIAAYRSSDETQQAYCRRNDLNPGTFTNWKIKLKKPKQVSSKSFVEITPYTNLPIDRECKIEISIGNISIRMREEIDLVILNNIVTALRGQAC